MSAAADSTTATTLRTFLIADVRGYTASTREHGDEALAVFTSASQAVRAAVEFQATCVEETATDGI